MVCPDRLGVRDGGVSASVSVCLSSLCACVRAPAVREEPGMWDKAQFGPGLCLRTCSWRVVPWSLLQSRKGQCMCFPGKFPAVLPQSLLAGGISLQCPSQAACQVKALSPAGCVDPCVVFQASSAEGRARHRPWSRDKCCPGAPPSPTRTFWMS